MTCVRLARGCVVIAGLVALRAARAETPFAPMDVEYRGGEGCPDEAAFLERLHARTMGSWDAGGIDRPRQVLIAVEGSGAAAAGRLTIVGRSGETTTREVSGQSCEQVVDALAFVVALALDPTASADRPPAPPISPAPPEAPAAPAAPEAPAAPAAPSTPGARWRLSAAAHAGMTGAFPAGLQVSVPVFVELGREPATLRGWSPGVRLGFERGFGASVQVPVGVARFTWNVGRLDLCAGLSVTPTLSLGPCLGVDAGALEGAGSIAHPRNASSLWIALGGLARGRWQVRSPLFLEVEAGAVFPLVRDTFVFDPQTYLYKAPATGARVSGGVGAYFW
jgi:hypothetical protein